MSESDPNPPVKHFIEQRIEADIKENTYAGKVITRFPPEPNGYLHIGHAKSICLNFTMARQYEGVCHLRFDDTNPKKEDIEYMEAIKADIHWLGFSWDQLHHTADYFEALYTHAMTLIEKGLAYVCSLSADEIREYRGTLTEPGKDSPHRKRSIEENIDLFNKMRNGDFADGTHVLRAKIDMSSGNINLRDPIMYRIMHETHPHTEDDWCIYPTYDFAHCVSDAIEAVTHSLCTLEFQDHRPLYDWYLSHLFPAPRPQQIEFSRLNVSHTITSKRKLKQLVDENIVSDWDDPRMPTLVGLRRRGFTASAIEKFCKDIGVSKSDSVIDMGVLEECVRDDLNKNATRAMCVIDPLKITIKSLAPDHLQMLTVARHPNLEEMGSRQLALTQTLYIERDDFMETPPKKYFRLSPGKEVRLRGAYVIKCESVIKDPSTGEVVELICTHDPETLGKKPEGRKVKGVIHWVSCSHNQVCEIREYDRLFKDENPSANPEWLSAINPNSLNIKKKCYIEQDLKSTEAETHFQFERLGYYVIDRYDSSADGLIFNKVVSLRNSW